MRIEPIIISNLLHNEEYMRRVLPFLKAEYFSASAERTVFSVIEQYITKYNGVPTAETALVELSKDTKLPEEVYETSAELLTNIKDEKKDIQWLIDQTEQFCQDRAVYNAIMDSIAIIDGKDRTNDKGAIPSILSDALAVSFDNHIGHDFFDDAEGRYKYYHKTEDRLPFDIELLNTITNGGVPRKTLNIIMGGTGVGKTMVMCHFAAANLMLGKNVLYITMEMAEERIAERIDANLLNIPLDQLANAPPQIYASKITALKQKTLGKLIIKEYPTATVGVGHFRHLLNELNLKKGFKPDVIYIDYLNICVSSRLRANANASSYIYVKSIAEEIRGLAVERNVPIFSATQLNREGFADSDPDLTNTSESFGLPATADFMMVVITNEELDTLCQLLFKQLKNRYRDERMNKRFVVGVDRSRMRLYDAEQKAQEGLVDTGPVMDRTSVGSRISDETVSRSKTKRARNLTSLFNEG